MIKLIVSDLDGTLLNTLKCITSENLAAIHEAQDAGVEFMIATGRPPASVRTLKEQYGLKCRCIMMNGAQYADETDTVIEEICLDADTLQAVIGDLRKYDLPFTAHTNDGMYTSMDPAYARKRMTMRLEETNPHFTEQDIQEFMQNGAFLSELKQIEDYDAFQKNLRIFKIEAYGIPEQIFPTLCSDLQSVAGLTVIAYNDFGLELTAENVHKGNMLRKVITHLGLQEEEVMVIGDSSNDIGMLKMFKHSYAMSNAEEHVKDAASYVCGDCDQDGVALAIRACLQLVA